MMDKATQYLHKIQIQNLQRQVDKDYEKHGLTDEVLDKQLEVNKLRHKHDISDKSNRVHEEYVQ